MTHSLDTLAQQIREFGAATFPTSTPESTAEHLRREVVEILADPTNGEEQADAFFLLVQLARVSGNDLAVEVARKLEINKARTWKPADHLGVVEHVKYDEDCQRFAEQTGGHPDDMPIPPSEYQERETA
jgi:NTP pyrophosphatase (non-canonical NTP hydrolase)